MKKSNIILLSMVISLSAASKTSAMEKTVVPTYPNLTVQRMSGGHIEGKRMEVTYFYTFKKQANKAYMLSMQHGYPYFGWKETPLQEPILMPELIERFKKEKFQDPKAIPKDLELRGTLLMIQLNQMRIQKSAAQLKEKAKKAEELAKKTKEILERKSKQQKPKTPKEKEPSKPYPQNIRVK